MESFIFQIIIQNIFTLDFISWYIVLLWILGHITQPLLGAYFQMHPWWGQGDFGCESEINCLSVSFPKYSLQTRATYIFDIYFWHLFFSFTMHFWEVQFVIRSDISSEKIWYLTVWKVKCAVTNVQHETLWPPSGRKILKTNLWLNVLHAFMLCSN